MYITPIYQVPLRQPWYHIMQFFLLYAHACACTRMHRLYIAPAESIHGYAALVHQAFVFSLYIAASILHLFDDASCVVWQLFTARPANPTLLYLPPEFKSSGVGRQQFMMCGCSIRPAFASTA